MSGELTPAETTRLLHDLDALGTHVVDTAERIGGKLGGHIEWLENRVQQLESELDSARDQIEFLESEA